MATTGPSSSSIAAAFDTARKEFLCNFPDEDVKVFSKFTSIDDVYDATDEIQREQEGNQTLRNLAKIQPYLECLNQYSGVLDTIVQIKPDVLAVIWVSVTTQNLHNTLIRLGPFENGARSKGQPELCASYQ